MTDEALERADFETWYYACSQVPFQKPYAYTVGSFTGAYDDWKSIRDPLLARIEELEKQVATERDDALEEAEEAIAALNESAGDAAAYDGRRMYSWEREQMELISRCAAKVGALKSQHADKGAK